MPLDIRRITATTLLITAVVFLPARSGPDEQDRPSETLAEALDDTAMEHAAKHLDEKYVCPMHPQIIRDEPGSCPICGMDLVLKQIDAAAEKRPTVTLRRDYPEYGRAYREGVARDPVAAGPDRRAGDLRRDGALARTPAGRGVDGAARRPGGG
ncbi:MAG: heavy metal-binding domain-containing protein [Pseudomonadota bacterium]|nr:heavy metal-binding domain-containing protein [Pseudomonadota bacterium]